MPFFDYGIHILLNCIKEIIYTARSNRFMNEEVKVLVIGRTVDGKRDYILIRKKTEWLETAYVDFVTSWFI